MCEGIMKQSQQSISRVLEYHFRNILRRVYEVLRSFDQRNIVHLVRTSVLSPFGRWNIGNRSIHDD